ETWYSSQTDLGNLIQQGRNYVKVRRALLGVGTNVQFLRASTIPPNRVTQVYFTTGKEGEPDLFTTSPDDDHDPTQVDLLVRIDATPKGRRQLALSGLPDSVTDQLLLTGVKGAFTSSAAYKQWSSFIQNSGWGIRVKTAVGPPPTFTMNTITMLTP